MTVIPSGFAQINFVFAGAALPHGAEVTLGANISSYGGTPAQACSDAIDAWTTNMSPRQISAVNLASVRVKFGPNNVGPSAEVADGTPGGAGGAGVSSAVSVLIHKVTGAGGRAGRGRMFVPGVQETDVSDAGVIGGATLTAWQGSATGLLNDLGTALLIPALLHGVGSPITTPSTILSLTVDSIVGTQRRRQRR